MTSDDPFSRNLILVGDDRIEKWKDLKRCDRTWFWPLGSIY